MHYWPWHVIIKLCSSRYIRKPHRWTLHDGIISGGYLNFETRSCLGHYNVSHHWPPASKFSQAHANSYRLTARITIFLCMPVPTHYCNGDTTLAVFSFVLAFLSIHNHCEALQLICPINQIIVCQVIAIDQISGIYTSIRITRKPAHLHMLFC